MSLVGDRSGSGDGRRLTQGVERPTAVAPLRTQGRLRPSDVPTEPAPASPSRA